MSAVRAVLIRCDGCGREDGVALEAKRGAAERLRESHAAAGWTTAIRIANPGPEDKPTDLCPKCAGGRKLVDVLTPEACADWLPVSGPLAVDMRRADW